MGSVGPDPAGMPHRAPWIISPFSRHFRQPVKLPPPASDHSGNRPHVHDPASRCHTPEEFADRLQRAAFAVGFPCVRERSADAGRVRPGLVKPNIRSTCRSSTAPPQKEVSTRRPLRFPGFLEAADSMKNGKIVCEPDDMVGRHIQVTVAINIDEESRQGAIDGRRKPAP